MKILTVIYDLDKGGTQRAAQTFAEGYYELAHDSRILALYGLGSRHDEIKKFIKVWFKLTSKNLDEIKEWNPDIIHIHSHGPEVEDIDRLLETVAINCKIIETNVFSKPSLWADKIDVSYQLSHWAQWIFNLRGGHNFKSAIVPYPVKCKNFHRALDDEIASFKNENLIPNNAFVIGRIGQSYSSKWSPMIITAFNDLAMNMPNIYLLIISPPDNILNLGASSPYKSRIIHIPKIIGDNNLQIAYSSMDIMLLIAEQGESFGMVIPEAILCGTPVIAYSTPWADNSQCEVVGNGKGGFIVNSIEGVKSIILKMHEEAKRGHPFIPKIKRIYQKYDYIETAKTAIKFSKEDFNISTVKSYNIYEILMDSFDRPSFLTKVFIKANNRFFRRLTKYSSKHEKWSKVIKDFFYFTRK